MMSVSRETEYHTYHLTIAEAKALREALEGSGSFAHRAVSFAEQQEFVDGIWRGIAARCHCDFNSIMPASPPSPSSFRALPRTPKPDIE